MSQLHILLLTTLLAFTGITLACDSLRVRDWDLNDVESVYEVPEGGVVALICDGTCQGIGFTPSLTWSQPNGRQVDSYPGRVMSVFQESRRQLKLYLQDFRSTDEGRYTCRGWVKGQWKLISVYLKMTARLPSPSVTRTHDEADTTDQPENPVPIQPLPEPIIAR